MGEAKRREKLGLTSRKKKVQLNKSDRYFHGFQLPNQQLRNTLIWV